MRNKIEIKAMKRFKCIVTRIDEYEIELDENIINEEWMEDYRKYFQDLYTLEELAHYLAQYQARFPSDEFIEGFGNVKRNGFLSALSRNETPAPGINIKIISQDDDCDVDVEEMGP